MFKPLHNVTQQHEGSFPLRHSGHGTKNIYLNEFHHHVQNIDHIWELDLSDTFILDFNVIWPPLTVLAIAPTMWEQFFLRHRGHETDKIYF